jgi:hypothetical protein
MDFKTGDILFTSRKPKLSKPKTYVAFFINLLQTKKLRNLDQTPTHTGTIIFIYGMAYVIDSDTDGVDVELFEKWAKGRSFINVFRPNVLNDLESVSLYTERALSKAGNKYGWKSANDLRKHLQGNLNVDRKIRTTTDFDLQACSIYNAWIYNLKDWQIQTPQSLWVNRFKNFPNGEDCL